MISSWKGELLIVLLLSSVLTSCGGGSYSAGTPNPTPPSGNTSYFPYQQGWLGADGAYSVPLGGGQSLWIFGDTFVGPSTATSRVQATVVI